MKNEVIAKTLLTVWPGLQDYETMFANRALTHALDSYYTPLRTERLIDKIIDLNVKQQTIHNLRRGLQRLIDQMSPDLQTVVRHYYRPYEAASDIAVVAQTVGMAERSFYRRLQQATTYVANRLSTLGINFFTWQYLLQHHPWFKETFTRTMQTRGRRLVRQPQQTFGKRRRVKRD